MKRLFFFLCLLFIIPMLNSFVGRVETKTESQTTIDNALLINTRPNYTTWSIKVNRDCYLVLNDVDWGAVFMDTYIEIPLSKGMNSLKFTKGKGGETLKKEIFVVENTSKQKREIILLGKVIINKQTERDQARKRSRRKVSDCGEYRDALRLEAKGHAVVAICVNPEGYVVSAEFDKIKSDSLSQEAIDLVVKCAKEFQYEARPDTPTACGSIIFHLGIH